MSMKKSALIIVAALAFAGIGLTAFYLSSAFQRVPTGGCTSYSTDYLIIASNQGFNDSVGHGAPSNAWPILCVHQGDTVNITVKNVDVLAHGFNIENYYNSQIVSVGPGHTLEVSFVADKTGTFTIYCSIFCEVHPQMQRGELVVAS